MAACPSCSANAPAFVSSRSFALRLLSSGPWHLKQVSENIGRMSRSKSTFAEAEVTSAADTRPAGTIASATANARMVEWPALWKMRLMLMMTILLQMDDVLQRGIHRALPVCDRKMSND